MTINPSVAGVEAGCAINTDRELYREESGLPADGDHFYAPSIQVTAQGGIGINVGGSVIVMPLREWHALARIPPVPEVEGLHDELVKRLETTLYQMARDAKVEMHLWSEHAGAVQEAIEALARKGEVTGV